MASELEKTSAYPCLARGLDLCEGGDLGDLFTAGTVPLPQGSPHRPWAHLADAQQVS